MVKPRFPGHVEAPSATRRATDKWAHDTMRPEQLDSGSTHTSQPQEGCALLHPLQGVSLLSTPLQGGILKPPALRVVVDLVNSCNSSMCQLKRCSGTYPDTRTRGTRAVVYGLLARCVSS